MYKNKLPDGSLNVSGTRIRELRKSLSPKTSQNGLAVRLQNLGLDLDKNAIQRIESGKRFITDIELRAFAAVLNTTADELLGLNPTIQETDD